MKQKMDDQKKRVMWWYHCNTSKLDFKLASNYAQKSSDRTNCKNNKNQAKETKMWLTLKNRKKDCDLGWFLVVIHNPNGNLMSCWTLLESEADIHGFMNNSAVRRLNHSKFISTPWLHFYMAKKKGRVFKTLISRVHGLFWFIGNLTASLIGFSTTKIPCWLNELIGTFVYPNRMICWAVVQETAEW